MESSFFSENAVFLGEKQIRSLWDLKTTPGGDRFELSLSGTGNTLRLNPITGNGKCVIRFNQVKNCSLVFGKNNRMNNQVTITFYNVFGKDNDGSAVVIGTDNIFNGNVSILAPLETGHEVRIGNDNLFAGGISFRGCNEHTVWDLYTGEKLNVEHGISVGDHNWFCEQALILNNAVIKNDSVISARALVNKAFSESNLLLAGVPATIKRRHITWDRKYKE